MGSGGRRYSYVGVTGWYWLKRKEVAWDAWNWDFSGVTVISNVKMVFITIKNGHKRRVKKRSLQEGKDYLLSFHVMVIYENTEMTKPGGK